MFVAPFLSMQKLILLNYYNLMSVYDLSLARIDSQSESDDSLTPNDVKIIVKRSKFFQNDDREPQNAKEVGELIRTFNCRRSTESACLPEQ